MKLKKSNENRQKTERFLEKNRGRAESTSREAAAWLRRTAARRRGAAVAWRDGGGGRAGQLGFGVSAGLLPRLIRPAGLGVRVGHGPLGRFAFF